MRKTAEYKAVFNGSIIELRFNTIPRRGWFKEHVQPVIDVIKTAVPHNMREYNSANFTWSFALEVWPTVKAIVENTGFLLTEKKELHSTVEVPHDYAENFYRAPEPLSQKESKESLAESLAGLLGLSVAQLASLDTAELKRSYRQKARQLHPDIGGDAALMSELNRVWSLYNSN